MVKGSDITILGYQTAYSQLAFAGKKESDFLTETVPQLKMGLAKGLEKMSASHPGKVGLPFIVILNELYKTYIKQ